MRGRLRVAREGADRSNNVARVETVEDHVRMMSGQLVASGSMSDDQDPEASVPGTGDVVGSVPDDDCFGRIQLVAVYLGVSIRYYRGQFETISSIGAETTDS